MSRPRLWIVFFALLSLTTVTRPHGSLDAAPGPIQITSIGTFPACPVIAGTTDITWVVGAIGGVGPLQFRFWLRNATAGTWELLRDYAEANTAQWMPAVAGTYFVQVWVRSAGSSADWEAWSNSTSCAISNPAPPTITSVTVAPGSSVAVGTPVTWTAAATGGPAPLQYRFWLRNATAGTWELLQDYTDAETAQWTPRAPGVYFVQAWVRSAGSSAEWEAWSNSAEVETTEGALAPPQWTVIATGPGRHTVNWAPVAGSDRYRVYWASTRQQLLGELPDAEFLEVAEPPLTRDVANPEMPTYYRVFGMQGPMIAAGGYVAVSTTMEAIDVPVERLTVDGTSQAAYISASLWDVDGDGCLDIVGARGTCDGNFRTYSLEQAGLAGLFASGRINRDSRFADFNGDGHVDIFTNVYSDAGDPSSKAILHINNGAGHFTEDLGVRALGIGGFGETVLTADFDNDGDIDIFIPHYWHRGDGGRSWLLINDGAGGFTDIAEIAGVGTTAPLTPEGAQATDFNQDGWVDILVASHLYINNGDLTFTDRAVEVAMPAVFDEGLKLFDADMDGDLDLLHHDGLVTRLHRNVQGIFDDGSDVDGDPSGATFGYGLTVCDVNGDGFEDALVARNSGLSFTGEPHLLINVAGTLTSSDLALPSDAYVDLMACGDLDRSGLPDILARWGTDSGDYRSLMNRAESAPAIRLRVVGSAGERNQQGRVVLLKPQGAGGRTMMRVVESGSGYLSQGDYDLLVAAPWPGSYEVWVRFSDRWFQTTARAGDALTIYADGHVEAGLHDAPSILKVTSVTPTPDLPVAAGTSVTWTATAAGGTGPYTYRFLVYDGTNWSVGQEYSSANTWTWTPPSAGSYTLQVWTRNAGSTADYDAWRGTSPLEVTGAPAVSVTSLTPDRILPVPAGTPVKWTATSTGGTAPHTYAFFVYDGSTWRVGQDWSAANTWTWVPPASGSYTVQVWARNAGSLTLYDAWLGFAPVLVSGPAPLSIPSLTIEPTAPLLVGVPAVLTSTATGGTGPYTYLFLLYDGSTWSIAQDWSTSNTWTWTPSSSGTYTVQVWLRNAGSAAVYDQWQWLPTLTVSP